MFTIDQVKAVHSKMKSGAYFPGYVKEMAAMGVTKYAYAVSDGTTTTAPKTFQRRHRRDTLR